MDFLSQTHAETKAHAVFFSNSCYSKARNEHLPPHKTPAARDLAADLFSRPGKALLASRRAREHVLDVQRRQPAAGDGALPGEATRDQARGDLDDPGSDYLDSLRRAHVGCVLVFDTRARRWTCGGVSGAESGWNGSNGVALGVWVVSRDPVVVAFSHGAGTECKSRARGATWMGSNVSLLLVVLAGSHRCDSPDALAIRPAPLEYLARRTLIPQSTIERTVGAALRGRPAWDRSLCYAIDLVSFA